MTTGGQKEHARYRQRTRRAEKATLASVALHIVLGLALLQALRAPVVLDHLFGIARSIEEPREELRFVDVSPSAAPPLTSVRTGASPVSVAPPIAVPVIAPREVPTALPPVPPASVLPTPATGAPGVVPGPLAGGVGPTRGALPSFDDPRVWVADPPLIYAPKTGEERLDSALVVSLARYRDSLETNTYVPNSFERGDWTFEKDGKKYGIDQSYIRLGKFSIPTPLLALLPLNLRANPIAADRNREMSAMRADIVYHAQVALNEEEFRRAVRAIRDRKEREGRTEELRRRASGTIIAPGERPPR